MLHKHFDINDKGRDFVVGDLHGCLSEFESELKKLHFDYEFDRMFSVGDLIDRCEDSLGCLKLLDEPWFHPVYGNHEEFMVMSVIGNENPGLWFANGGEWCMDADAEEVKRLCSIIADTVPYAITEKTKNGDVGICHAQPPSYNWEDTLNPTYPAKEVMLWARTRIQHKDKTPTNGIWKTIHGHTPVNEPVQFGNAVYIDTGCVFGRELTVAEL